MSNKVKSKKALITGISGQDGTYLAELLLSKGYQVHGTVRSSSIIAPCLQEPGIFLHEADLGQTDTLKDVINTIGPDEIYNLAAQSSVAASFDDPEYTAEIDGVGTLRLLESVRSLNLKSRFYQASTSELYGQVAESPQNEKTAFHPRSPYAVSKMFAYWITVNYREAYGMYACNGILFNHDSPRRGQSFVSRKITKAASRIRLGLQDELKLGNLNAKRDWGHAKDYVEMQWLMLQQQKPDDFVIATGVERSVREFVECAFAAVGIQLKWKGDSIDEKGYDVANGKCLVSVDPSYFRPSEVGAVLGDATKAREELGWVPRIKFDQLVKEMIDEDMRLSEREAATLNLSR